jgi:hypothetical protein
MQRLMKSLFILLLLAGQFQVVVHAYDEHDFEHPCDICITLKQQEQATNITPPGLLIDSSYDLIANQKPLARLPQHVTFFAVRAPPSYL